MRDLVRATLRASPPRLRATIETTTSPRAMWRSVGGPLPGSTQPAIVARVGSGERRDHRVAGEMAGDGHP
ncbi:hypothetical protein [Methylobacterium sp. B4]|uniref:hypothetical protein n=1 Tax=Methylobacterium sp. B4 TaxID=1938755 RepID=UPI000D76133C|nr:hypothetical protein [Methylobacterium sp. B4]PXW53071.1 hypothetical protein BY998_12610 [Methylobacterium sp. B4]